MGWYKENKDGLIAYRCQELNNPSVIQAFSTRSCGNMGLHTGDFWEQVVANRRLFLDLLGLDLKRLIAAQQIHGTMVERVDEKMAGAGALVFEEALSGTDALITRESGVILSIYTADCLPIFIYDSGTPAVGIVHAGWRGTIERIAEVTIDKMIRNFSTNPAACQVAIGPAICKRCFRVAEEVARKFAAIDPETVEETAGGFEVDLQSFNLYLLQGMGVPKEQILVSDACTSCGREEFFSYRAECGSTGRMMGIIALL
ncbi:MAG: peptidoglycan editing factor PgeF [Bacillota bacterium]